MTFCIMQFILTILCTLMVMRFSMTFRLSSVKSISKLLLACPFNWDKAIFYLRVLSLRDRADAQTHRWEYLVVVGNKLWVSRVTLIFTFTGVWHNLVLSNFNIDSYTTVATFQCLIRVLDRGLTGSILVPDAW